MQAGLELHEIRRSPGNALYEVLPREGIEVLIASDERISQLLINPHICGPQFQAMLSEGLAAILTTMSEAEYGTAAELIRDAPFDVLYILRGGLNFDLHRSLAAVTGRLPEVSFISSQRIEAVGGFDVGESSYLKWSVQDSSLLCVGDISATATTLKHALDSAIEEYHKQGKAPRWVLVLTIGTSRIREMLIAYRERMQQTWAPGLMGITVVYLEEIFSLYTGDGPLASTHLPYTDFFRMSFPAALEFEAASLAQPVCFLERCAIYDGGSRAFEPKFYLNNLRNYWIARAKEKDRLGVYDLLGLKSNLLDYQTDFAGWLERRPWWASIDHQELRKLHKAGQKALTTLLGRSIADISEERLATITKGKKAQ